MKACFRISTVGLAVLVLGGCNGGVVDPGVVPADAAMPKPDLGPDVSSDDVPVPIIKLDAAPVDVLVSVCGNGAVEKGEDCDDGNTTSGDGCTSACKQEKDWVCPTAGAPCISLVVCGDKRLSGNEQCDDGNTASGDGCGSKCQLEPGWKCPVLGAACVAAACGDGIVAGSEQCDDGNTASSDGCSGTCQLEPGYACGPDQWHPAVAVTVCYKTVCGDGHVEGTEQCDNGDVKPFDGCSPHCTYEPTCGYPGKDASKAYQCFSVCGDGIKMPDEECDDGNLQNGDGCSSTCTIEKGFACTASAPALGDKLTIPILYRDFNWHHPQFEVDPGAGLRLPGIAKSAIGVEGKPVYDPTFVVHSGAVDRPLTMDGPAMSTTGTLMSDAAGTTFRTKSSTGTASLTADQIGTYFAQWYTDDPKAKGDPAVDAANPDVSRITIQSTLELKQDQTDSGTYQYYSSAFFPLDGLGFGNISYPATNPTYVHNYSFTSEAHYWFQYNGGETLEFRGDDDVWVFVNGQLAVDLGGIHNELRGIVTLNGADTSVCVDDTAPTCVGATCDAPTNCTTIANGYNLKAGNIYEIIVFQAERHVVKSNYKLTLRGFNAPTSTCRGKCGDAVVTKGEACDLGEANNTGAYGTCNPDCTLPPRCGDGVVQSPPEECDDGVNLSTYGQIKGCAPGCKKPPYCGDGKVDSGLEECDEGANNGGPACTTDCKSIIL